jgi:hypothetical protein
MAFASRQTTLVASTPTALLVSGTGTGFTFKRIQGTLQDPLPVIIKNEDAAATVWIGGPDVSATQGQSLAPGATDTYNLYGELEIPYAWSTGTPVVSVLVGRQ